MYQHLPRKSDVSQLRKHELKAVPYSFRLNAKRPIYLIHIAKCAGGFASKSMAAIIGKAGGAFDGREICFPAARLRNAADTQYVTLLRSPRTHDVSQFFMLKKKEDGAHLILKNPGCQRELGAAKISRLWETKRPLLYGSNGTMRVI